MTTVYFVRHGTTDSNIGGRFQGSTDVPLGEMGLRQADALAERFRGMSIDAVYCSPLTRAVQTAQGVCRYLACEPHHEDGLREVDGGLLENQTNEFNEQNYPGSMTTLRADPAHFNPPEGEPSRQVWARVRVAVERIVAAHPDQTIAIVSHGFALMTYLGTVDAPFEEMKPRLVSNASVTTITYQRPDEPCLVDYNDVSHLPDEVCFRSKFWKEDVNGKETDRCRS
ncbi:MAG: histidine phosphatase family protein [Eubacteriales bacterium]|nr:histidine phosphatase family protein [Eubacteriales bacterium]